MRIVLANNYFFQFGGVERVMFNEMDLLLNSGHEIAPFSRQHPKNFISAYSKYFPPTLDFNVSSIVEKVYAAKEIVYSRICYQKAEELIRDFKPDVIHAHNIYGRLTTGLLDAANKHSVPVVLSAHDYKLVCPSYLMLNHGELCDLCIPNKSYNCFFTKCHKDSYVSSFVYWIESFFNDFLEKYKTIQTIVCPSQFMLNTLSRKYSKQKLVHLPNIIDSSLVEPSYKNMGYYLFVGRLSHEKGLMTLLRAASWIDIPLWIAGSGPLENICKKFIEEKKVNHIKMLGYKNEKELYELYKNAMFTVVPSEWYENFPMVIIESFAHGKPVIGSNIGGIPEMVFPQKTGVLFNPGNVEELISAIKFMGNPMTKLESLGKNARAHIEQTMDPKTHLEKLLKIYKLN